MSWRDERILADEVVVDYADNGFAGEKVKKAVNAVRAVFFDDTLDAFEDFACSMVEERDTINCIGLEFLFESLNNKDRGFTLFIPVSVARSRFEPGLNEDTCADVNMEMRIKVGVDEKNSCVLYRFNILYATIIFIATIQKTIKLSGTFSLPIIITNGSNNTDGNN